MDTLSIEQGIINTQFGRAKSVASGLLGRGKNAVTVYGGERVNRVVQTWLKSDERTCIDKNLARTQRGRGKNVE